MDFSILGETNDHLKSIKTITNVKKTPNYSSFNCLSVFLSECITTIFANVSERLSFIQSVAVRNLGKKSFLSFGSVVGLGYSFSINSFFITVIFSFIFTSTPVINQYGHVKRMRLWMKNTKNSSRFYQRVVMMIQLHGHILMQRVTSTLNQSYTYLVKYL